MVAVAPAGSRRTLTGVLALALSTGTLAASPSPAEPPASPPLTLLAVPSELTYGAQIDVTGSAPSAPATQVQLQASEYRYRAFRERARVQSAPDGGFAFAPLRPLRDMRLRAALAGAGGAESAEVQVTVDPRLAGAAAVIGPGRSRLSVRVSHTPQSHPSAASAVWYVAPAGRHALTLAAITPLRTLSDDLSYADATIDPPARRFTYRVCLRASWERAMGPPAAPRSCPAGGMGTRPAGPLELEARARGLPLGPYPPAGAIAAAERWLAGRAGRTAFALLDSAGHEHGVRVHDRFQSASVVKVVMLVAYLQKLGAAHHTLAARDNTLLYPMIHNSDNAAASAVLGIVGPAALARVAREAGMRDFSLARGWWAFTQTSAADQAQLMAALERLVPARFHRYARALLSAAEPAHSWGIPPVARPRWRVFFKTGSLPSEGLFNEVALLQRGAVSFSLAVLTTGDPSPEYGHATIAGVASVLLAHSP